MTPYRVETPRKGKPCILFATPHTAVPFLTEVAPCDYIVVWAAEGTGDLVSLVVWLS